MDSLRKTNLSTGRMGKRPPMELPPIKIPHLRLKYTPKSLESIKNNSTVSSSYRDALKYFDITPNPTRYRNPFKPRLVHKFLPSSPKDPEDEDKDFSPVIDSLLYKKKTAYLTRSPKQDTNINFFKAELSMKNATRLKPSPQNLSNEEEIPISPIEDFWLRRISNKPTIRWDLFEESLLAEFIYSIDNTVGYIRKINWDWLLRNLYRKLSEQSSEEILIPGHPAFAPITYSGPVVSFKSFESFVTSGKFKKLLERSIGLDTNYLTERFKQPSYQYTCGGEYKGTWRNYKRNSAGTLKLPDGSLYEGMMFSGSRDGYGIFKAAHCEYQGYWEGDCMDGAGTLLFADGSKLEGIWKVNRLTSGRLTFKGGYYEGFMNELGFSGVGTLIKRNGEKKTGTWSRGKLEGKGEVTNPNGNKFVGSFVQDLLTGEGRIETPEFKYEGWVEKSRPHGIGKIVYKTGAEYQGKFEYGEMNGEGVYKEGALTLTGEFIKGKLSGKGEKRIEGVCRYVGEFSDGMMDGSGVLRFYVEGADAVYKGGFRLNKFSGFGELKVNGIKFSGNLISGERSGDFKMVGSNFHFTGKFNKGVSWYKGTLEFDDGTFYSGEWVNGVPNGAGEARDTSMCWISGVFLKGMPLGKNRLNENYKENIQKFKNIEDFNVLVFGFLSKNVF